ncbi:MAG: DUF5107 domain-containing protein [Clostridiales bacterium]|nr:DUF5107 domain-containing protein [Clostridiales bacterium]
MTTLRFDHLILPAADFPKANPLPDVNSNRTEGAPVYFGMTVSKEDPERLAPGSGGVRSNLPYQMLDDYDRNKLTRGLRSIVLENDYIRAEFVPRLGGRLWSILDKSSGRELLHRNPVFQPANLAILNAWFSGGVEYNCGTIGHTVFTASPLYVDFLEDDERGPVLRMYEYERVQRIVYQIDFYLPENSKFLMLRVCIHNPNNRDVPMYWWSNISVDQRDDVRIIAPTNASIGYDGEMNLKLSDYPDRSVDFDCTYPANFKRAKEYFFYIPDEKRHYEAAVGGDGFGFVQTSTARQKGRKMFLWGTHQGGKRWQEYLSVKGSAYIEIQAGLGRSQAEMVLMPANSTFEWTEAYGAFSGDPKKIHGTWEEAKAEVEEKLELAISEEWLIKEHEATKEMSRRKGRCMMSGSPWGALERMRRQKAGEADITSHLCFECDDMDGTAAAMRELVTNGTFPNGTIEGGFMVDDTWLDMMHECANGVGAKSIALHEHMGIAEFFNNHLKAANAAWEKAINIAKDNNEKPGFLSLYCKAIFDSKNDPQGKTLYDFLKTVVTEYPDVAPLAIQTGVNAISERKEADFIELSQLFSDKVMANGRIMLQLAECHAACGHYDEAKELLLKGAAAADIREGETLLGELWYRIHEAIIRRDEGIDQPEWESVSESAKRRGSASLSSEDGRITYDAEIRIKAEKLYPLPSALDFRMTV